MVRKQKSNISKKQKIEPDIMLFINKLGKFYESLGLPHISGRIIGLLLVQDSPFSPEDLAKILKISRSSISTNIKLLTMYGFLEDIRIPGVRRKYFTFSQNAWENSLQIKIQTYSPFHEILEEGIRSVKKNNRSPVLLEELLEYTKQEKKLYENLLKNWKSIIKKKQGRKAV